MFWGFSEAENLYDLYKSNCVLGDSPMPSELNILIFGCGDPRHIIKTISTSYQHTVKINFYIAEGILDLYARNFLLLTIALEPNLSPTWKTHLFMDVYGNTLLRPISSNYIGSKVSHFEKIVTDDEYRAQVSAIFDFSLLKYRERDHLQNIFHFWANRATNVFNVVAYWETRLRETLKMRYDHRNGAFDWDLMMRLKEYGAKQICSQEYQHWRENGVAYTFPEFEYSMPNKSLVVGLIRDGETSYRHRGYTGDMSVGPYAGFGLDCDDPKLLTSNHGVNVCRATDVTYRNLLAIFYEVGEKKKLENVEDCPAFGSVVLETGKSFQHKLCDQNEELAKFNEPLLEVAGISVKFVSNDDILEIGKGVKFRNKFDVIAVGNTHFPFVQSVEFQNIFNEKCLVVFETRQISTMKKEQISEFLGEIKKFGYQINGLELVTKFTINRPYPSVVYKYTLPKIDFKENV